MKALIDADVLVYSTAFAAQKTQYHVRYNGEERTFDNAKASNVEGSWKKWAKDNSVIIEDCVVRPEVNVLPKATALFIAQQRLDQIRLAVGATSVELYATGDNNFRDKVAVTKKYKGNRHQPKPVYYGDVFDYYLAQGTVVVDGMEADDMLGIRQTECERSGTPSCICSVDADLWQIPGRHYNWNQEEGKQKFRVTPEKGHLWFMVQALAGDATDNVPGLAGIGEGKAMKALVDEPHHIRWSIVQSMYDTRKPIDYLAEQGRLVWILRERNQVWTPDYYTKLLQETYGKG